VVLKSVTVVTSESISSTRLAPVFSVGGMTSVLKLF